MYELDRKDRPRFETLAKHWSFRPGAVYDVTFENRFVICHVTRAGLLEYLAYDKKTGRGSVVCSGKTPPCGEDEFFRLIPRILNAIKYTGDKRVEGPAVHTPEMLIDLIFRVLLPRYGYRIRQEQIRLAKQIYHGLTGKKVAICEAEVGTGKTLAYLVAGFCARRRVIPLNSMLEPITIVTSSIELQTSIMKKEIPFLNRVLLEGGILDRPLTAVLRKGKEHYFCPSRFEDYVNSLARNEEKYGKVLAYFRQMAFADTVFDLDAVPIPGFVKNNICVKGQCGQCKKRSRCRYAKFIRRAMDKGAALHIQVTNHNLYLMSTKFPSILQRGRLVIVDEAHKLREAAQDVFGEQLEESQIPRFLSWSRNLCAEQENSGEYSALQAQVAEDNRQLFAWVRQQADGTEEECSLIACLTQEVLQRMQQMISGLQRLSELMQPQRGRQEIRASTLCSVLEAFGKNEEMNIWVDGDAEGGLCLCCSPRDMGKSMNKHLWQSGSSYALMSGTMSDGESFSFFRRENGLDRLRPGQILESMTGSPFDYAHHSRLYMPGDLPLPDSEDFADAAADRIVELVEAANGHTAILFTSYALLHQIYDRTRDRLSRYELICMGRNNKTAIADFRKSRNAVLYASGSMWEGVDCAGDRLSSVIIVRLPFPMRSAALEQKKEACGCVHTFVQEYAVPEMLIKLRQGCGRLIRGEEDTGVLSILDSRACAGSPYRAQVEKVLKKYPRVDTVEEVAAFMKAVKDPSYFRE